MSGVSFRDMTVRRRKSLVLDGVTATLEPGNCAGLIGPNGAGKTTLLRAILGLLPHEGTSDLASFAPAERARRVAWMPQSREIAWPVSVETLIAFGRTPYSGRPTAAAPEVRAAIERLALQDLRERTVTELSGGEQARVLIARVLAQNTPVIFADEPIAGLDPAHQFAVMEIFRDLARDGRTILIAIHDLALAARHCDRLLLLSQGTLAADGDPRAVLSEANLERYFNVRGRVGLDEDGKFEIVLRERVA